MENPTPPICEADLARASGLAREDLKKLRAQLTPELDWYGGKGNPVMITERGRARLTELLEASMKDGAEKEPASALEGAAKALAKPDRYVALTVVRVIHSRALLAKKDGAPDREAKRVITKVSEHFRPGMKLSKCEPSTATPGVFYYHGKLPRRAGKW